MYENLTEADIDFVGALHDPIAFKESIFPENLKAPHTWDDEDCELVKIRNYQYAWQNYSVMYADDDSLTKKENYQKKRPAGICYNIGARNTGKSYDFIQMDIPMNIALNAGDESCLGSATAGFLKKVVNPILNLMREHSFLGIFKLLGKKDGIQGGNETEVSTRNGHTFYGRNEKVDSPEPGTKFQGLHYKTLFYEETSYATEAGEEKRVDSGHSFGVIERFSGIPDIKIGSPLGKILYDESLKKYICRLPQYVRDDWDNDRRQVFIEKYNGETSMAYKLNVIGEIIEGAEGFWDIERLKKKALNKDRKIKQFDIDKKKFKNFKQHIIIDRLPCEQIYCTADIGMGARPTEIIIMFYDGKKYKLVYNIILNKLTSKEQAEIFAFIYRKMGSCFIGIDSTTDYQIIDILKTSEKYKDIKNKHLFAVDLRKNIDVEIEKDEETGLTLRDKKGNIIIRKMVGIDWAMTQLEDLFYDGQIDIPLDNKFFKEFSGFKVLQTGLRKSYASSTTDDYHQAFQIFAICRWQFEWETLINTNNTDTSSDDCLGIF